ncbi:MAG: tetratricopeptide repeat protein [Bacteroidota bacterium]
MLFRRVYLSQFHLNIIILFLILFLGSCRANRQIVEWKTEADTAFEQQEYEIALQQYEKIIDIQKAKDELPEPDIKRKAGLSAFNTGNNDLAADYLMDLRNTEHATRDVYYALAIINQEIDNLSLEISALENYVNNYPEGKHIDELKPRLLETYVESKNYSKALVLWEELPSGTRESESMLNHYFVINKKLDREKDARKTAKDILNENPEHREAMEYMADHYFWKAEHRYQKEMKAYEKNRTTKQYRQLLDAFEILNTDFRKSLNYYLKLYEMDPDPKYARFIGNIYLRYDDKKKARYYHEKAGI